MRVFLWNIRSLFGFFLVLIGMLVCAPSVNAASRDILWDIATNCLDLTAENYCAQCSVPRIEKPCPRERTCEKSLEIWAESNNYVALRDRKMCGCPSEFVHGVAIPRARVTGVEDPRRPAGIWEFAWAVGRARIRDESSIALVVNPARKRSQDQLHVHIVRLQADARQRIARLPVVRVQTLEEVWRSAERYAAEVKLDDYGVLVATHPEVGFLVLIDKESPERSYTEAVCR